MHTIFFAYLIKFSFRFFITTLRIVLYRCIASDKTIFRSRFFHFVYFLWKAIRRRALIARFLGSTPPIAFCELVARSHSSLIVNMHSICRNHLIAQTISSMCAHISHAYTTLYNTTLSFLFSLFDSCCLYFSCFRVSIVLSLNGDPVCKYINI